MTGKTFLPRLFIFQVFEILVGICFLYAGYPWLAAGCALAFLAFTLPVRNACTPDWNLEINGEILTILHAHNMRQIRMLWSVRIGTRPYCEYEQLKAEELEFRKLIEIDPSDPRCIYRWKV